MGVDVEYYLLIGIKGDYTDFKYVRDKNELISLQKSDYFDIDTYKHIIIGDYLPPDYTVISDGMCCEYSVIGKVLDKSEYLDTIKYTQIGYKKFEPDELEEYGKQAGFENVEIKEIMKGKGFVVIYTK